MSTNTRTQTVVDLPNDSTLKLLYDGGTDKKVYITAWLGSASGYLFLWFQNAEPTVELPDAMIGPQYGTHQEDAENFTGKIWGKVFNDHADDFCIVSKFNQV